ncbi:MAG: hypothetical protein ACTSRP_20370 [Candidatus Helarchaeota archaeon]
MRDWTRSNSKQGMKDLIVKYISTYLTILGLGATMKVEIFITRVGYPDDIIL